MFFEYLEYKIDTQWPKRIFLSPSLFDIPLFDIPPF